ncbi:hypothetical protein WOC76_20655 [Methylocystis sp. IM3]|uniref:hypothetical protein n=1 Tax=unclassified Methylocystis TaxID=2625913 RepID=UPI0030F755D1
MSSIEPNLGIRCRDTISVAPCWPASILFTAEKAIGKGVIKAVNKEDHQLQITHEAIPAQSPQGGYVIEQIQRD